VAKSDHPYNSLRKKLLGLLPQSLFPIMNRKTYLKNNGVSEEDWKNTPNSFKDLFDALLERMKKITLQLHTKQEKLEWFRKRLNEEMRGTSEVISAPRFKIDQKVEFIGGIGEIRDHYYESGSWTYYVEMAMGVEPDFGRIGCETVIMLPEPEIKIFELVV
jgi:hypothetical protein